MLREVSHNVNKGLVPTEGTSIAEVVATRQPMTKHNKDTEATLATDLLAQKLVKLARAQRPKMEPIGLR